MMGATTTFLSLCVFLAAGLAILRFVLGPSDADRIVALDILFAAGIALCGVAALYTGRVLFLDVAIGVALIGFIATLAWARVVEKELANTVKDGSNRISPKTSGRRKKGRKS